MLDLVARREGESRPGPWPTGIQPAAAWETPAERAESRYSFPAEPDGTSSAAASRQLAGVSPEGAGSCGSEAAVKTDDW